ncbi:MFS transporter [Dactylosporangium sp. NPDC048998]|uniref:MFS transporter n=1 Tax=Dactylosporangium sp. NPDC048998 TaxID=3363976 RepID=UPI003716B8D0
MVRVAVTRADDIVGTRNVRRRGYRPGRHSSPEEPARPGGPSGREFVAGFRHIRAVDLLAQVTAAAAVAFAVLGLYETVAFAIIDQGLGRPPFFGVLTSVQGLGGIAAGLTVARLCRTLGEARLVGLAMAGFATSSLVFTTRSTPVVLVAAVVNGVALAWFVVGFSTALQRHTPPRLQGRVNAAGNLQILTPQNVSIALGAMLITVVDYRLRLLATVVVTAGSALCC